MKILASAAITALILTQMPAVASAQDLASNFKRDKNTSVRQRPRPDYEALGVKAGGFTLYPRVTVEATRDDNIYAVASGEQSDTVWRVKPELAVRSNWSRNAVGAFASASVNRYSNFSAENAQEYTVGLNGRVDIERGSYVSSSAQWQKLTEPRSAITAGTPAGATAKPVKYSLWSGNVTAVKELNRLRLTGNLDNKKFNYVDQGRAFNQNTRDRDEFYYGVRAEYAVSPDTAVFGSLLGNKKNYDLASAGRDSDGYVASVGANFELAQTVRGDVEGGYMSQSYDNPIYTDINGFSAKGRVEWFPTELTTVNVSGSRSIEESVAVGSQGFIANNVSVGLDHELLRNVLLSAQATAGKDSYERVNREDKRKGLNLSAAYLLNRKVGLFLNYGYLKQTSSGSARASSFTDNKLSASVALQF